MNVQPQVLLGGMALNSERVPSLDVVFRRQLILIDQLESFRLLMALLAAGTMFSVSMDGWFPFNVVPLPMFLLVSIAWTAVVWRAEPPSRRGYHRTAPIPTLTHDLLKIAAGGAVLTLGIAIVLSVLTVAWFVAGLAPYLPLALPLIWAVTLSASLLVYVLVSCIPMLTDRPLEWMIGLASAAALLAFLAEEYKWRAVKDFMYVLTSSPVGLSSALIGPIGHRDWNEGLFSGYTAYTIGQSIGPWVGSFVVWSLIAAFVIYSASRIANRRSA